MADFRMKVPRQEFLMRGTSDGAITGQIICATNGLTQGGNINSMGGFIIKASPVNTGRIGVASRVSTGATLITDCFLLAPNQEVFVPVANLNLVRLVATVASEVVCWIRQ